MIKSTLAALAAVTCLIAPANASTHIACGDKSFVVGSDVSDEFVSFHNGGAAYYNAPEQGIRDQGTWKWVGRDAVTIINGNRVVWDNLRNASCDWAF